MASDALAASNFATHRKFLTPSLSSSTASPALLHGGDSRRDAFTRYRDASAAAIRMLKAMRRILAENEIRFIQLADPSRSPGAIRRERREIYFEYLAELSKELSAIQLIRFANTGSGAWTFAEVNRDGLRMRRVVTELRAFGCLHFFRLDVGEWCARRIDELDRLIQPPEGAIPSTASWQPV